MARLPAYPLTTGKINGILDRMKATSCTLFLALAAAAAIPALAVTKARYLDLMELAVDAYTPEHMERYLKAYIQQYVSRMINNDLRVKQD